MNELNQWYNQISSFPKLNISSAQNLYNKAINTQDKKLKNQYLNDLIYGTLYVVYEYIKRNELDIFISSSYDMNDIINTFNEVWIKKIYNGELLKVDRYSLLFTSSFFSEVYNKLCGDKIIVSDQFEVSIDCFSDLLESYIQYKNSGSNIKFKEIIKETFFNRDRNRWSYAIYNDVLRVIPLLDKIYNNLNFNKIDDLNIGKSKIKDYLRLMINIGLIEPISKEILDKNNIEKNITNNMVMKNFINDIDNVITDDRARQIIHDRFGLDNNNPQFLEEVGKKHNLTKARVGQIEAKTLRLLRKNQTIRKYKDVSIYS